MPDRRPIGDLDMLHPSDTDMYLNKQKVYQISIFEYIYVEILIGLRRNVVFRWPGLHRHVGLRWVSDQTSRSPIRHDGLRYVSDNNNILENSKKYMSELHIISQFAIFT